MGLRKCPNCGQPATLGRDRMQKLVDLCYDLVLTATDEGRGRDGKPPARWFRAKGRTTEQKAAWVTDQLRGCGFDTSPCGATWGLLKDD